MMESCLLCLEVNKSLVESIKTNSAHWLEYHITEIIEKHFWPLKSLLTPLTSSLCLPCWQELNNFHKFYMRVEEAHINFGRLIKVGDKSQILEIPKSPNNGLIETEILFDIQQKKDELDELEILTTIKSEPQDESLDDVPIEDISLELKKDNDFSNGDPLEKPLIQKSLFLRNKKKIETRLASNTLCKGLKEKAVIKKENQNNDSDDNDSLMPFKNDLCNNSHNNNQSDSDSSPNMENKQQKKYYKHRTNRKEHDQFIAKHFKDIVCDLCKFEFESIAALREHFATAHKQKGYVICCNKKFFNRTRLVDHIHSHLNPDHFKCSECGRIMSDRLRLESHMLRFHGATELEKKHCDVCQKPFIDGYSLRIHKLTHLPEREKKFPCTECGKFYATSYLLKSHKEAVHLKKFVKICYICGKSIASSADYKVHMNKHEGISAPDIYCDVCGLRLASERGLKRHKESQHPVGGKKEHPCPICPKISPTLKALKKHINTMHERGYDHKCTICEKAFKRADGLKEHMASHTGTALYTCPWCPKTFNSNGNMHAHRKRVHPKEWEEAKLKKYSGILPQFKIAESAN